MTAAAGFDGHLADMHERDERIQRERAEGTWEIHVESPPPGGDWRALRRALRLSRADLPWLKQRVPGVVRRGAEIDLAPVVERIVATGVRATLRRRPDTTPSPADPAAKSKEDA